MNRGQWKRILAVFATIIGVLFIAVPAFAEDAAVKEHETEYKGVNYARVYDYDYYTTNTHPELAGKSDAAVLKYFVKDGIKNGEQAIESFSVRSYRNANQDLRKKYDKDYERLVSHYIKKGWRQNRTTTGFDNTIADPVTKYDGKNYDKVYDFHFYIKKYASVRRKYALDDFGAIKYFVKKGIKKKHQACENFNVMWYYNSNQNMRYMCGQDWERYYNYYQKKAYKKGPIKPCEKISNYITYFKYNGKKVDLSPVYDFEYYTKHNKEASKYWKKQDDAGAIKYFVSYGMLVGQKANKATSVKSRKYKNIRRKLHPNLSNVAYIKANHYSSRTKYLIMLNQGKHMVYIFKGKKGSWTCIRSFPCDIGKPSTMTPEGRFSLGAKGLYFDSGSARCWYYSAIYGSILFHSVLYYQESGPYHIMDGTMSASVSHGCVRLALSNAKYIYDNIPSGTTIVSYNRPF